MIKLVSGIALASLMALAMGSQASAQERTFRKVTSGEPASLHNAMTQSQARRACSQELRGTREGKSAIRQKMTICMDGKMQGN
ncbi:hypothetical protein DWF00_16775 [Bosea caraganae]|uniref:Phosphate starvation-inducible protein PsiF n=1 Tax=Bosea caraganae TaxID=2763117 RepID=A0A370KYU2_9HYPH|nr:hypothetical protein [Bosea caraganae]RDJ20160.1 hypothetical protein DWE98_26375 [Bosea caraganae]RDJ24872.1 hypothetical protein DWF00_16775 [Bosea caraganae]